MQPLAYQPLTASCWVTSMTNGIILLRNDKAPFLAYRWLHEMLTEDGVSYYTKQELKVYEAVIEAVSRYTGLAIRTYQGSEVETALRRINFDKQVAVCDIHGGEHSILINGRDGEFFLAFDPQWKNVSRRRIKPGAYETQPRECPSPPGTVNLKVHPDHLLRRTKGKFQLGTTKWRYLAVLEIV